MPTLTSLHRRSRQSSEGDEALSNSGTGRRLSSKHLERKEKFHGSERPPSSSGVSAAGPAEALPSSSSSVTSGVAGESLGGKGRGRKESATQHDHKRRKEEEGGAGSLDTRSTSKKRKRDQVDDEPPAIEAKKLRSSEYYPPPKDSDRTPRSREGGGTEMAETRSSGDRKRRHDTSVKDGPSRKHPRSKSPETPKTNVPSSSANTGGSSSRRHERHGSSGRSVTSPNNKKGEKGEHHHRSKVSSKKTESTGHESNEENDSLEPADAVPTESARKKLDWASVSNYTRKASTKLEKRSTSALERFSPGVVFARIGVSPSLAGKEYFDTVSSLVSMHLKKTYQHKTSGETRSNNTLPDSLFDSPFEGQQFASSCVSRIKQQLDWERMVGDNIGPCRRALTASADYAIRRNLKKSNQVSD